MIARRCKKIISHAGYILLPLVTAITLWSCSRNGGGFVMGSEAPIDLVDPNIGSLAAQDRPLGPLIFLPHSMLRVSPCREDFRSNFVEGLPLATLEPRDGAILRIYPSQEATPQKGRSLFDEEHITPYSYHVSLDNAGVTADYALLHHSGIYRLDFSHAEQSSRTLLFAGDSLRTSWQYHPEEGYLEARYALPGRGYLYAALQSDSPLRPIGENTTEGSFAARFEDKLSTLTLRYAISLISAEQALASLRREIPSYEYQVVAKEACHEWEKALDRLRVEGGSESERKVFYTALYRTLSAPICTSEDGQYYSPYDDSVHYDQGIPFYTSDPTEVTFRTLHPLMALVYPELAQHVAASFIRMAQQSPEGTFPAYPSLGGDIASPSSRNRAIPMMADAMTKGITDIDLQAVYNAATAQLKKENCDTYDLWGYDIISRRTGHGAFLNPDTLVAPADTDPAELIRQLEPYNIRATIMRFGSTDHFEERLEERLEQLLLEPLSVHNFYGYYLYAYTPNPGKGQKLLRHMMQKSFRDDPAGFPASQHGAAIGSSVVFSMMGFYPVTPGSGDYTIGVPFFNKITIDRGRGRNIVITTEGLSEKNKYITRATLGEKPIEEMRLPHSQLTQGGKIYFKMGSQPAGR